MAGKDWTREQTVRLIRSLKKHEVLWNSRSKSYKVRKEKEIAWNTVEKDVGSPANECKRRLESLLAACRREKNKIMKSKSTDEPEFVYQPKWIYWKELSFVRGVPESDNDLIQDNLDILKTNDEQHWAPSSRRPLRKRRKAAQKNNNNVRDNERKQSEDDFIHNVTKTNYHWDGDEYDAYGITVAAKLRKMEPRQRLIAENIINQTLYKGMLSQLSVEPEYAHQNQKLVQQQQITDSVQNHWRSSTNFPTMSTATDVNDQY